MAGSIPKAPLERAARVPGELGNRRSSAGLVVVTLALSGVVVALQQTLLLPLLSDLPRLLDTSVDTASWLVTATLLTGAIATPTVSRLADMYGKRRMMVVALAASVAGSLLGAFSHAVPLLITARALQGVGMALIPVGIAIMRDELPREKVPLGVALMSATLAIGAGVGLPLSGVISEHLDWHAIFWVTGIVGAVLVAATLVVLPESPVRTRGKFDLRGAVLLSIALTAGLLALSKGGQWGWLSPVTLGLLLGGALILAIWVPLELRTPRPLVDVRVASRRAVVLVNAASLFVGFALFVNMLVTIELLQLPKTSGYGLGLDTMPAGLAMVPNAAAFAVMAPVSARLIRGVGPQVTLLVGAVVMFMAYVTRVFFSDTLPQVIAGSVFVALGSAMTYSAMPTLIMRAVPVTETASANGLNVLLRAVGTSTASATTAVITTLSAVTIAGREVPSPHALDLLFWLAAGAALGAAGLSIPMLRMREYAEELDRSGAVRMGSQARVVRGRVLTESGRPVPSAVVTVLTPAGQPVDWGQADSEGTFTTAIPCTADYLVVTAAEGWRPRSRLMTLHGDHPMPPIVLRDRLTLKGIVTDADHRPVTAALVVLTRHTGELVAAIHTDHEGSYEIARPHNGRYVLTVSARTGAIGARNVTVWEEQRSADLQLGTPLV